MPQYAHLINLQKYFSKHLDVSCCNTVTINCEPISAFCNTQYNFIIYFVLTAQ